VEPRTSCQDMCRTVPRDCIKFPSLLVLLAHLNSDTHSVRWITYVLLGVSGACLILLVAALAWLLYGWCVLFWLSGIGLESARLGKERVQSMKSSVYTPRCNIYCVRTVGHRNTIY
jgi:hypothetical protein